MLLTLKLFRTKCMNQMRNILKQVDFIATPTSGGLAVKILEGDQACESIICATIDS